MKNLTLNKNKNLNTYLVISPVYTYTDIIDAYIGGPSEDCRDTILVLAENSSKAKAKAVKWFRENKSNSMYNGENPFKGLSCCILNDKTVKEFFGLDVVI
jgi:hypothetical protein